MEMLFILLIILYIFLFIPVKINVEYYNKDFVIIRIILLDIFVIPCKSIIKNGITLNSVRKILFSIISTGNDHFSKINKKMTFIKDLNSHITINYLDVVLHTDEPFNVSSYYFCCSIFSNWLNDYFYDVKTENYKIEFDTTEYLNFNFTISIKSFHFLKEIIKNINNLKYIFGRRLSSGKSN